MAQLNDPTNEGEAMSEHYYRVGVHGPPNPKKHPWVMVKFDGGQWRLVDGAAARGRHWGDSECWFPVEAPPSELAPEPEDQGVEVDGQRWRLSHDGRDVELWSGLNDWSWRVQTSVSVATKYAKVAVALGLVDQPPVPRALIDWLERCATRMAPSGYEQGRKEFSRHILDRIEAGEFGPVEGER